MIPLKHKLHLRVLHQHGMALQTTLTFTDDTVLGEKQFADFVPETERAWLTDMQCTVCWRTFGAMAGGWWLVCNSRRWACSVNDVPLHYQQSLPLHAGDRIELGMLHLEVGAVDTQTVTQHAKHVPPVPASSADLFDIVPDAVGTDFGGAMLRHSLVPVLSDQDIINGKHLDATYIAQTTPSLANMAAPLAPAVAFSSDAPVDGVNRRSDDDVVIHSVGSNIVEELAKDYIRAIQDPASLHAQLGMQAMPELSAAPLSTPTELAAHIPQHLSIEDMVSGELGIANLLQQFGKQEWQSPSSAPDRDVLKLFAQGIAIPEQRVNLPALTRREHHAFSPDSSYRAATDSRSDTEQHGLSKPMESDPT
jgi:hypothetical protein